MFYDLNFPFCPFLWSLLVTQWDRYLNPNNWCRSSLWEFTLNSKRLFTYIHSCKILFITDRVFSGFFAQTVEQLANVRTSLTYKKQYETLQLEGNSLTTSKYFKAHKMVASNKKTTNIASSPSLPAPLPNQTSKPRTPLVESFFNPESKQLKVTSMTINSFQKTNSSIMGSWKFNQKFYYKVIIS